jgi:hypothetical protein
MIKRRTAVLVSTVAGIVFLFLTALPHHHHHSQICFQNLHCHEHNDKADNTLYGHKHDSKNEPESHQCALNLQCLLPSGSDIINIRDAEVSKHFSDSQIALFDYSKQQNTRVFNPEDSPPGVTTFYTFLVTSSLGLRAPPSI